MSTDLHARLDRLEAQLRRQQRLSRLCLGLVLLTAAGAWWTTQATRNSRVFCVRGMEDCFAALVDEQLKNWEPRR
jgi:hypothetical protein